MYFNATINTFLIWFITVLAFIGAYEAIRYLARLFIQKNLRWSMLVLFVLDIYPHYYSWWAYVNYLNDEFYLQCYHQLFFSFTELVSTIVILISCDKMKNLQPHYLVIIIGIAILHIFASSTDQFLENVLLKKGRGFQISRDLGFMAADLVHVMIPVGLLRMSSYDRPSVIQIMSRRYMMYGTLSLIIWFLALRFV